MTTEFPGLVQPLQLKKNSVGIKQFYGLKPALALGDMQEIKYNAHHTIVQIHIKQWMSIIMNKIDFNVLQSKIHL